MRRIVLTIILMVSGTGLKARAQDAHYWDNQYGTKGELLGGVVVGSPGDLSATFYNPGWIALSGDPAVLLTTWAAEAYSIKVHGGLGQGIDPESSTITTSPGYLAGRFSSSTGPGWKWAYSYLQKVKFEFDASEIRIDEYGTPPPEGSFWFSGESFRKSQTSEYWYGVTMSRRLRDNIGLGFSPYVVQRTMKSRTQTSAQTLSSSQDFSQAYAVDHFSFWHVRLLAKVGLAVEQGNLTYGLTLTTPSLGAAGSGSVYHATSLSGVDLDGDTVPDPPYLSANHQEDLSASWNSPLSVAAGVSWRFTSTGIHLTAEWFNSVPVHRAMDPDDFVSQSNPDQTDSYNLEYGAKSLVNVGVAFDRVFTPKFSLYGAFRSDFSSLPPERLGDLQISSWDLWHISSGASFTFLDIEFTAGLQYSFGSSETQRFINFNTQDNPEVSGEFGKSKVDYNRVKALVGFNLPFGKGSP